MRVLAGGAACLFMVFPHGGALLAGVRWPGRGERAAGPRGKVSADGGEQPEVAGQAGEEELAGLDTKPLVGHLAAWNYFESIDTPANKEFIEKWHEFTKKPNRTTNDPMEAHVIGFNMWVKAVEKAQSFEPYKVIAAMIGVSVPNLTGGYSTMMPNHHITKPVYIGEIQADGQLNTVWQTPGTVVAQEWSPYLEGSKDLIADWVDLKCGNYNKVTKKCGG